MTKTEHIQHWSKDLTAEQMRPLLVELVDFACDAEMVDVSRETSVPYWSNTGEPLIAGQRPFEDG